MNEQWKQLKDTIVEIRDHNEFEHEDVTFMCRFLVNYMEVLEKEPCEMTAEEYRQRMIQAFHNADTDELIALCVLPTEKEFEHLEWLLKNHYKQEPKTGHWEWVQYDYDPKLGDWHCSECRSIVIECVDKNDKGGIPLYKYCPQCGAKMVEPQERLIVVLNKIKGYVDHIRNTGMGKKKSLEFIEKFIEGLKAESEKQDADSD